MTIKVDLYKKPITENQCKLAKSLLNNKNSQIRELAEVIVQVYLNQILQETGTSIDKKMAIWE